MLSKNYKKHPFAKLVAKTNKKNTINTTNNTTNTLLKSGKKQNHLNAPTNLNLNRDDIEYKGQQSDSSDGFDDFKPNIVKSKSQARRDSAKLRIGKLKVRAQMERLDVVDERNNNNNNNNSNSGGSGEDGIITPMTRQKNVSLIPGNFKLLHIGVPKEAGEFFVFVSIFFIRVCFY